MVNEHPAGHHVRAVWKPGWHRLDQSIEVGQRDRFWFDVTHGSKNLDQKLAFFNKASSVETTSEVRNALVVAIMHPTFGLLRKVDTAGMDYVFTASDGRQFIVNAEEDPGMIYDEEIGVNDWKIEVTLSDVSEPLSELV
jgi:hypothetical protein